MLTNSLAFAPILAARAKSTMKYMLVASMFRTVIIKRVVTSYFFETGGAIEKDRVTYLILINVLCFRLVYTNKLH